MQAKQLADPNRKLTDLGAKPACHLAEYNTRSNLPQACDSVVDMALHGTGIFRSHRTKYAFGGWIRSIESLMETYTGAVASPASKRTIF